MKPQDLSREFARIFAKFAAEVLGILFHLKLPNLVHGSSAADSLQRL